MTAEQQQFVDSLRSEKLSLHQLRMKLQSLSRGERFGALLSLFTECNDYGAQQLAGRLLIDLKPDCPEKVTDILSSVAGTWNPSVEELPLYLSDTFGAPAVVETAIALEQRFAPDTRERQAMGTFAWWLKRRLEDVG